MRWSLFCLPELQIHNTHMGRALASTQLTQIYMELKLEYSLFCAHVQEISTIINNLFHLLNRIT